MDASATHQPGGRGQAARPLGLPLTTGPAGQLCRFEPRKALGTRPGPTETSPMVLSAAGPVRHLRAQLFPGRRPGTETAPDLADPGPTRGGLGSSAYAPSVAEAGATLGSGAEGAWPSAPPTG